MKLLLSCGEVSGDAIGRELARAFRELGVERIAGCAGPSMEELGVGVLARIGEFSQAGWQSVLAAAPRLAWSLWKYLRAIERFEPDLAVLVDAPGIHGIAIQRMRRKGVRCSWVCPPQLWAWKDRTPALLRGMDTYPAHRFEIPSLERVGANPFWWGYPGALGRNPTGSGRKSLLALLPGSRSAWRGRHAELFASAAQGAGLPLETVFVRSDPPADGSEQGLRCLSPSQAFPHAGLAISLPGTATLELACQRVPTLVAARPGRLDAMLARRKLAPGWMALPNRILGQEVFPELYAEEASSRRLSERLAELWDDRDRVRERLSGIDAELGDPRAAWRIADHVLRSS